MLNTVAVVRRQQQMTQEELARAVGVSRQTIIAVEKGNYEPSTSLALKIAAALAVPVDQIFWLTPDALRGVRRLQRPDINTEQEKKREEP